MPQLLSLRRPDSLCTRLARVPCLFAPGPLPGGGLRRLGLICRHQHAGETGALVVGKRGIMSGGGFT